MTPREAAAWLADHGYDDVTWQIEDKTPGVPKGQQRSEQSTVAPAKGKIAGAVFITRHGAHRDRGDGSGRHPRRRLPVIDSRQ